MFGDPLGGKAGALTRIVGAGAGTGLGALVGGPFGAGIGLTAGGLLPELAQKANARIATRVGQGAANANLTADAIERYLQKQGGKGKSKLPVSALSRLLLGN